MKPLNGLDKQQTVESSVPVIRNRGIEIRSFDDFCSVSGLMEKCTGT